MPWKRAGIVPTCKMRLYLSKKYWKIESSRRRIIGARLQHLLLTIQLVWQTSQFLRNIPRMENKWGSSQIIIQIHRKWKVSDRKTLFRKKLWNQLKFEWQSLGLFKAYVDVLKHCKNCECITLFIIIWLSEMTFCFGSLYWRVKRVKILFQVSPNIYLIDGQRLTGSLLLVSFVMRVELITYDHHSHNDFQHGV